MLFVIFIPWLGILVYLIARGQGMQERQLEQAIQMQRAQTEYIKSVAGTSGPGAADQIASAKGLLDSGAITAGRVRTAQGQGLGRLICGTAHAPVLCMLSNGVFWHQLEYHC